jgi:hypothetical protein
MTSKKCDDDNKVFAELKMAITRLKKFDSEIIYVDECVFSSKTYKNVAWMSRYDNVT